MKKFLVKGLQIISLLFCCVLRATAAPTELIINGNPYIELGRYLDASSGELVLRIKPKVGQVAPSNTETAKLTPADGVAKLKEKANEAPHVDVDPMTGSYKAPNVSDVVSGYPLAGMTPKIKAEVLEQLAKEANTKISDSPGLTTLGVTVGDINRPLTPKDVLVTLAKGTDASGRVKEGIALQIAPATVFFPNSIVGGDKYIESKGTQAWARTTIELATAKSEDKRIGKQLAASLSVGLIDGSDPRLYWATLNACSAEWQAITGLPPRPTDPAHPEWVIENNEFIARQDENLKHAQNCFNEKWAEVVKSLWKAPRWYLGYSKVWQTGELDKVKDLRAGPAMLWTSFSHGVDALSPGEGRGNTLFEFAASKKWHVTVADAADDTKLVNEDRAEAIARLRFSRDRWNAFADVGIARVRTDGILSTNVRRFGYGAEYKVNDDLWLVLGSIREHGYVSGEGRTLLNFGLKFGQTDKSSFEAIGK